MTSLQRHRLAHLSDDGWRAVCERPWDTQAQACVQHWAAHRLPLVVTRQPDAPAQGAPVALGLPAPLQWARRRLALQVPARALVGFDEFPRALDVAGLLPPTVRPHWRELCQALAEAQAGVRVYGGHGWQLITGLDYLRKESDLDLCLRVQDARQADEVAALLQGFAPDTPRLDGELIFPDGTAVAWREWQAWRAGRARHLLVKRLQGASLADAAFVAQCQREGEGEVTA